MTITQVLTLSVKTLGVDPQLIEKALIDAGIAGSATYTAADELKVYAAEYKLLSSPVFVESISEGGYTIKYNNSGIGTRLAFLETALGLTARGTPTVQDASYLW